MKHHAPVVLCILLFLFLVSCGEATTIPSFSGESSEGFDHTSGKALSNSSPHSQISSLPSETPVLLETDPGDSRKLYLSVMLTEDAGREISVRLYRKGRSADDPEAIVDLCQISLDENGKGSASLFRTDPTEELMLLIVSPSSDYEIPLLKGGFES